MLHIRYNIQSLLGLEESNLRRAHGFLMDANVIPPHKEQSSLRLLNRLAIVSVAGTGGCEKLSKMTLEDLAAGRRWVGEIRISVKLKDSYFGDHIEPFEEIGNEK